MQTRACHECPGLRLDLQVPNEEDAERTRDQYGRKDHAGGGTLAEIRGDGGGVMHYCSFCSTRTIQITCKTVMVMGVVWCNSTVR